MEIKIEEGEEYNLQDIFRLINKKIYGLVIEHTSCEDHDCSSSLIVIFNDIEKLCMYLKEKLEDDSNAEDLDFAKSYSSFNGDNNIFVQAIYSSRSVCYYKVLGLDKNEFKNLKKSLKRNLSVSKNSVKDIGEFIHEEKIN